MVGTFGTLWWCCSFENVPFVSLGGVRGEVFVRIPPALIAAGILVAVIFACRGDDSFQRGAGDLPVAQLTG